MLCIFTYFIRGLMQKSYTIACDLQSITRSRTLPTCAVSHTMHAEQEGKVSNALVTASVLMPQAYLCRSIYGFEKLILSHAVHPVRTSSAFYRLLHTFATRIKQSFEETRMNWLFKMYCIVPIVCVRLFFIYTCWLHLWTNCNILVTHCACSF